MFVHVDGQVGDGVMLARFERRVRLLVMSWRRVAGLLVRMRLIATTAVPVSATVTVARRSERVL